MNFAKITNINQLKIGDKVAITNAENFGNINMPNVNLIIGAVRFIHANNNENILIEIMTTDTIINKKIVLTKSCLDFISVYKITDNVEKISIEHDAMLRENNKLEKELKKAKKLNKKYRAMLVKRFGATEEQIDNNFNNKSKEKISNFSLYRALSDEIPYMVNGEIEKLSATVRFSANNKNHIKCELSIYGNMYRSRSEKPILVTEAIAICHKEDNFNKETGEFIAYNKAFAKAICQLH